MKFFRRSRAASVCTGVPFILLLRATAYIHVHFYILYVYPYRNVKERAYNNPLCLEIYIQNNSDAQIALMNFIDNAPVK